MFIAAKPQRLAFALRYLDGDQLIGETSRLLGRGGAQLTAQGERVLIGAGNGKLIGDVFRRLRHGMDTVQGFHLRVNKAPADGGIFHLHVAAKGALRFTHHKRRPGHALHPAGDHQLRFTAFNRPRRDADRVEAGATQAVDGATGHALRQPGQQQRHARHVAVVFPGLVGAAQNHIVNARGIQPRVTLQQRFQRQRREVVGAHRRQSTTKTAKGCTHRITDKCLIHHRFLTRFPPVVQRSASPE